MTRKKREIHTPLHVLIRKDHYEALQRLHPTLAEGVRRAIEEYINKQHLMETAP